jgi:fumarate reductase flavoprotein subunit
MLLDMRHLGEKTINERLPLVRDMSISYMGVDPVTDPVPVRPVVHYMMGGIDTDTKAATSLPGLYAAGECACVSINGANRLGSNSLTELLVFGRRAAMSAIERVRSGVRPGKDAAPKAQIRHSSAGGPPPRGGPSHEVQAAVELRSVTSVDRQD